MKVRLVITISIILAAVGVYLTLSNSDSGVADMTSTQIEKKVIPAHQSESQFNTGIKNLKQKSSPSRSQTKISESDLKMDSVPSANIKGQATDKKVADKQRQAKLKADQERLLKTGMKLRYDDGKTLKEFSHYENNRPVYLTTHNVNAAISAGIKDPTITPYGLTGAGVLVGVWDGGSGRHTHQDYGGRVIIRDGATNHYHATHVIGTITGSGATSATARGMAPGTGVWSYDWNNDSNELDNVACSSPTGSGVRISNHSYGYVRGWSWFYAGEVDYGSAAGWYWLSDINNRKDPYYGKYSDSSREYDWIIYNNKYTLPFISAGNSQQDSPSSGETFYYFDDNGYIRSATYSPNIHPYSYSQTGGYETIGSFGMAKNIMTVGAVNDAVTNGERDPGKGTMSYFSSFGPSDDGRVKPDIVANGVQLYSTSVYGDQAHENMSGTSMSSPSAAGTAALLQEFYFNKYNKYMWASTLKGLLIHGADDLGRKGPDYQYGWGLMNLAASIECLDKYDDETFSLPALEDSLSNGETFSSEIVAVGNEPLKVTLCWSDVPGAVSPGDVIDDRTPALVNDLDLVLRGRSGAVYYPYKLDPENPQNLATTLGTNSVDNVEQIYFATPNESFYTVEVSHKGTLSSGKQDFSIIVSGVGGGVKLLDNYQTITEGDVTPYDFGSYDLKDSGQTRVLTLSNTMSETIAISSITVSGDDADKFEVEYDFQSVEAGKEALIYLRSLNRDVGSLSASLNILLDGIGVFEYKFTILASFEHFPLSSWGEGWSVDNGWSDDLTELPLGSTKSFKSAQIGTSQTTEFSYTGTMASGHVTFWAKCSSEANRDGLVFLIDGVSQSDGNFMNKSKSSDSFMYSGNKSWEQFSFPVSSGSHTLTWRYEKDNARNMYNDCIWVDKVVIPLTRSYNSTTLFDITFDSSNEGKIYGQTEQFITCFSETTPVNVVPELGYEFLQWSDGDTNNPRVVSGITENVVLTAVYEDSPKFTVEFISSTGGSVLGETQQQVFRRGSTVPVVANADVGYEFSGWSNGEQGLTITLDNILQNETVTAQFVAKDYTISAVPVANGVILGELNQVVGAGGSSEVISAVADSGYDFVCWLNQGDGTVVSYESTIALNRVSENLTLTPLFSNQIIDDNVTLDYEGWHLISTELDYVNPDYFPNEIYEWVDGAYARPVSIENVTGLWVYHDAADSDVVNYSGLASVKTKPLNDGWNLYAPSVDRPVSSGELVYTWNGTHYAVVSTGELLTTGKAYWLFSYE